MVLGLSELRSPASILQWLSTIAEHKIKDANDFFNAQKRDTRREVPLDTKPTTENPSKHEIKRTEKKPSYAPLEIKSAKVTADDGRKITVEWEIDPEGAPQFGYVVTAHQKAGGAPIAQVDKSEPHVRKATLELPDGSKRSEVKLRVRCVDIFDNLSKPKDVP